MVEAVTFVLEVTTSVLGVMTTALKSTGFVLSPIISPFSALPVRVQSGFLISRVAQGNSCPDLFDAEEKHFS